MKAAEDWIEKRLDIGEDTESFDYFDFVKTFSLNQHKCDLVFWRQERMKKCTYDAVEECHDALIDMVTTNVKKASGSETTERDGLQNEPTLPSNQAAAANTTDHSTVVANMIKERSSLQSILEPVGLVELLGIVDLTLPDVAATLRKKLELLVPTHLHRIVLSSANPHLLRIAPRESVLDLKDFDIYTHHDLRALEVITQQCLDIIQAPKSLFQSATKERSLAVSTTIPLINVIFRQFNDVVELEWLEVETDGLKRHKWDDIGFANMGTCRVVTFLLELSSGTAISDQKAGDDLIKLYRNSVRTLNAIANHLDSRFTLHNITYVRQRHCQLHLPENGRELQQLLKDMPKVFGWCNGVLQLDRQLNEAAAD
ncbi:hypothetical protein DFQ28_007081 [Apophysomyces sp. BC1034]|nr:hypothetical protein DFQ28_007081 [Apophysomyces sp. BC1034]